MTKKSTLREPGYFRRDEAAEAFGKAVREIRKERKLTQNEVAARCGFDRTYPSSLERGTTQPTLHTILLMANALQVPPDRLLARAQCMMVQLTKVWP